MTAARTPSAPTLSVLVLADDHPSHASTVRDHVNALRRLSRHRVYVYNPWGTDRSRGLRIDDFDVVVIHYSLYVLSDLYLPGDLRIQIEAFDGLTIQFIQDDYRQVEEMRAMMRRLGVNVLFTLVPERELERVWPETELPALRKLTTYAGFVPEDALRHPAPPLVDRPVDVGYRGRELPYWLGILGQEKVWIAQGFLERAAATDLRCDIGWRESDRIYGQSWYQWLSSCRATLGTESGASITDFDGSLQRRVEAHLRRHPDADFWSVHRELLAQYEGNVRMNVISPRIFEAAALRTALVLFPGEYSGVVEPDRHYVALEKDFSNFDDVVARLRDLEALEEMTTRAWTEIACDERYSLRALVRQFDAVIDELGSECAQRPARLSYRVAQVARPLAAALKPSRRRARVVAGHGRGTRDRVASGVALTRVVATDPAVLRFFLKAAIHERRRPSDLAADLARLAHLRRAPRRRLMPGEGFDIVPELENGRLVLRAVTVAQQIERIDPREFHANGRIRSIVWDHGAVARRFNAPLTRSHWVSIPIDTDETPETYEFAVLSSLRPSLARELGDLFEPLLEPTYVDPSSMPAPPDGLALAFYVLRHVDYYAPKAVAALKLVAERPHLRALARVALADAAVRRSRGTRTVVTELVKLALLEKARRGELDGGTPTSVHFEEGALVFRTAPGERTSVDLASVPPAAVARIIWDHSELGPELTVPSAPSFAVGTRGVLDFVAVAELLRRHPRRTWRALMLG